jgi:predicted solute-binding protein
MKMEQSECSETSAYKIQTPGNYPEESIQHSEHGESLKSRIVSNYFDRLRHEINLTETTDSSLQIPSDSAHLRE